MLQILLAILFKLPQRQQPDKAMDQSGLVCESTYMQIIQAKGDAISKHWVRRGGSAVVRHRPHQVMQENQQASPWNGWMR